MFPRRKMVVVGDGFVGKTCLLMVMAGRWFPEYRQNPSIAGHCAHEMEIGSQWFQIIFCDTMGQEDYDRLRPLSYPQSAIVLICFAVDDPESFRNVTERWYPEVRHYCSSPSVPILLVGCKADLRDPTSKWPEGLVESNRTLVSLQQAESLASDVGTVAYMECSAKSGAGVKEVLVKAGEIMASWDPYGPIKTTRKKCVVL